MKVEIEELIEKRIKNFLGYGDPKARVWVMGMEEGGFKGDGEEEYEEYFRNSESKTFIELRSKDRNENNPTSYYGFWKSGGFSQLHELIKFLNLNDNWDDYELNWCKLDNKKSCFLEYNPLPLRDKRKDFENFWKRFLSGGYDNKEIYLEKIMKKRINLLIKEMKVHNLNLKYLIIYAKGYGEKYIKDQMKTILNFEWDPPLKVGDKRKYKVYLGKYEGITLAIIPHCSTQGMSKNVYKKIGEIIKQYGKQL